MLSEFYSPSSKTPHDKFIKELDTAMKRETISVTIGEQEIIFETGKIARQANGSVVVKAGETMVFASACAADKAAEDADFFPLRVDYQENFSSVGKTLSGFIKRQGRPSEKEILVSRLIDRPLRPMFEEGYFNEVQVLSYVWSYDGVNLPEPLAICAASAALAISDIPLLKPVAAVRVGLVNGKFIVNPTAEQQKSSLLDLLLAGTDDAVLMIEGFCNFLTEEQVLEAITLGHENIKKICNTIGEWRNKVGKPKHVATIRKLPQELLDAVDKIAAPMLGSALRIHHKLEREEALSAIDEAVKKALLPEGQESPHSPKQVSAALKEIQSKYLRHMIVTEDLRSDGRNSKTIRPIDVEQTILPRVHGSSLFTRGETQSLSVCTLGGESMAQRFEDLHGENSNRFYLHYFFPPFSVGEVGRVGAPGRREVGHGKLAERSLLATLPKKDVFPYVIRLESNITESNGSSSMATVCACCLAMMDAGVPINRPVAGIAMGLVLEGHRYTILSDILGIEDALGDMDFKVAGDKDGITAFQMDIKVEGITIDIMRTALAQAKEGRIHILDKMLEVCPKFRSQIPAHAPRIETLKVKPSKIATIIGPGGKQIRAIIEATGVQIDIDDEGNVSIASVDLEGIDKAKEIIYGLIAEAEIGKVYTGKIMGIEAFGVFVEILPGKQGLCHISEFDRMRIENMHDHAKLGDVITVKVLEINDRGQIRLSRKALLAR